MIATLVYADGHPMMVFDSSLQAWVCLEMLDEAFPINPVLNTRSHYIVCAGGYENAVMFSNGEEI